MMYYLFNIRIILFLINLIKIKIILMFGFKKWFGGSSSKTKEKESKDKESE